MRHANKDWLLVGFVELLALVTDQLSKWWAAGQPSGVQLNRGVSFGLFSSGQAELGVFTVGALLVVLWGVRKLRGTTSQIAKGLLVGGAVSNMVDRIWWHGVRDWLPIPFTPLRNNLADWCVVEGLVMLLLITIWKPYERSHSV